MSRWGHGCSNNCYFQNGMGNYSNGSVNNSKKYCCYCKCEEKHYNQNEKCGCKEKFPKCECEFGLDNSNQEYDCYNDNNGYYAQY